MSTLKFESMPDREAGGKTVECGKLTPMVMTAHIQKRNSDRSTTVMMAQEGRIWMQRVSDSGKIGKKMRAGWYTGSTRHWAEAHVAMDDFEIVSMEPCERMPA